MPRTPLRIINGAAPIRVADMGGWSDTWFARHGQVFSIAVAPLAEVQIRVFHHEGGPGRITIHAENYGERFTVGETIGVYGKHPLLEAAMEYFAVPGNCAIDVSIYSETPAGCSTGTSASVSVALLGALDRLRGGRLTPHQIAMAAQQVETSLLRQQCGIQDQLAAAYGGINWIRMHDYPHAAVERLPATPELLHELESRLVLIYVGGSHNSSETHCMVIRELEAEGANSPRLEPIRRCAEASAAAFLAEDLPELGRQMIANTEAQRALHPGLIGPGHQRVIDVARGFRACGWKVNGAGGAGGSVTLLSGPDHSIRREMVQAVLAADPSFRAIPIALAPRGLRVWESAP